MGDHLGNTYCWLFPAPLKLGEVNVRGRLRFIGSHMTLMFNVSRTKKNKVKIRDEKKKITSMLFLLQIHGTDLTY
jgi:hypothetical protein